MSQKKLIIILTICFIICLSFPLLNNNNRIDISNNDILTAKQAEAATLFSNIEVTARKDTSATIQYNTDIAATGQIEYGLTASYGNLTTEEGLSCWQSIELTDLTEGTTYYYRIISKDIDDNETISNNYTFTTRTQLELEALVRAARTNNDLPKTYYVKTDGDDTKDGLTIENAWQSPATAAQRAEAGDTIYLMDGTWYDEHVIFANSGIDTHPITITAYNGIPTMKGNSSIDAFTINKYKIMSHIVICDIKLKDYRYGIYGLSSSWLWPIHNITIFNMIIEGGNTPIYIKESATTNFKNNLKEFNILENELSGYSGSGIYLLGVIDSIISKNYIHDANDCTGVVSIGYILKNCTIKNNIINNVSNNYHISMSSLGSDNNIIDNNTITN